MSAENQHIVSQMDGLAVSGEDKQRAELVIHRPDYSIRDTDSYGHDAFPPKG